MNTPDSIFCTRLGGAGDTDKPGVSAEAPKWVVGGWDVLWFGRSMLTWSRSRPKEGRGVQNRLKMLQ